MADSSPPQQQSQSQQSQQQHRQPHSLNTQSSDFVPGSAWRQPNSHTVPQPAPPQLLTTSTVPGLAKSQPGAALRTQPRSNEVASSSAQNPLMTSSVSLSWANFKTRIEEDDREMMRKAQEGVAKLGGEGFRPELRETYNDRRGGREVTVRGKSGGVQEKNQEEWEEGSDGGVRLQEM